MLKHGVSEGLKSIRPAENHDEVIAYSIELYVINDYNSITEAFIKELVRRIQYAE